MVPADNPNVLTVGDMSPNSAKGPTVDGRIKPEILVEKSEVRFTNGLITSGTSNAAAMIAGASLVFDLKFGTHSRTAILNSQVRNVTGGGSVGNNNSCITPATRSDIDPKIIFELGRSGRIDPSAMDYGRLSNGRYVLYVDMEPMRIPLMFANALQTITQYGKKSSDYLYYIAPTTNTNQYAFVDTIFLQKGFNYPLPSDTAVPGKLRFVEIRQKTPSERICSTGVPLQSGAYVWKKPIGW
jgi:hypothetical protein